MGNSSDPDLDEIYRMYSQGSVYYAEAIPEEGSILKLMRYDGTQVSLENSAWEKNLKSAEVRVQIKRDKRGQPFLECANLGEDPFLVNLQRAEVPEISAEIARCRH